MVKIQHVTIKYNRSEHCASNGVIYVAISDRI